MVSSVVLTHAFIIAIIIVITTVILTISVLIFF